MRFREFNILSEQSSSKDPVLSDLMAFLSQEQAEFENDPDQTPEISMDAIKSAMQNLGHTGFHQDVFSDYFNDEGTGLKNIVDSVSNSSVKLKSGSARTPDAVEMNKLPPEEVVGNMARRAAKRGQD
jgi:hypothetical protein